MGVVCMNVLVVGGLGYIGSHISAELYEQGHTVTIVDNLSNSSMDVYERLCTLVRDRLPLFIEDATNEEGMDKIFYEGNFDGVVHLAGYKSVEESIRKPLMYYQNNLVSTMVLANLSIRYGVKNFVFSSSATVYGDNDIPYSEEMELKKATNPYGSTKMMGELILEDMFKGKEGFSLVLLRYFNPIGAHESGLIGESLKQGATNLMPYVLKVARKDDPFLMIFGDDYDTKDGTGVRDYIHVVDLAKGHVKALELGGEGIEVFNLGTGKGTSVKEVVDTFIEVNRVDVPYKVVDRRPGDLPEYYASVDKAEQLLSWKAEKTLEDMCRDSWRFAEK